MVRKSPEKFKTFQDVFDRFTLNNLFKLGKYFEMETLSPVSIGKESNIFSARARVGDREKLVAKIHRLETSDFNVMYSYIRGDPRFAGLKKRRREIIFAWAQREYRNLMAAREAEMRVPLPIAFMKNIILMEFIGNSAAAPQLKDSAPGNPDAFFADVVDNVRRYYRHGFVHGDLSKFNILNYKERPVFIDFSQGTPLKNPRAQELLERDVKNIVDDFAKLGVKASAESVLASIRK